MKKVNSSTVLSQAVLLFVCSCCFADVCKTNGATFCSVPVIPSKSLQIEGFNYIVGPPIMDPPFIKVMENRPPSDVCVILVEGLCSDRFGDFGHERGVAPTLDAFALESVRFEQAIASSSRIQPFIMSLMMSFAPDSKRLFRWTDNRLTEGKTLAEVFREVGYRTVGFARCPMESWENGCARGFDIYQDCSRKMTGESNVDHGSDRMDCNTQITNFAKDWILHLRDPDEPLFLFLLYETECRHEPPVCIHGSDGPLDPNPCECPQGLPVDCKDGIRQVDACISNLLAAIQGSSKSNDTVFVIAACHSQSFRGRDLSNESYSLREENIRVPLLIRPVQSDVQFVPGQVHSGQVGLIDVAPTLADLIRIQIPQCWEGRSLVPALQGKALKEIPIILDNCLDSKNRLRAVRTSRWKISAQEPFTTPFEIHDLLADPCETNNLVRDEGPIPREVRPLIRFLLRKETSDFFSLRRHKSR